MPCAYVLFNVSSGSEDRVLEKLRSISGVEETFFSYGIYDLVIKIKADSMEQLNDLKRKFGIYSLSSKEWTGVLLHPTFYTVVVRNNCGKEHTISYSLEADNHHSRKHQHLIETIQEKFKSMLGE